MISQGLRCINCSLGVRINFGRWLPLCWQCWRQLHNPPLVQDRSPFCYGCGNPVNANRSGRSNHHDLLCDTCQRDSVACYPKDNQARYCRICGEREIQGATSIDMESSKSLGGAAFKANGRDLWCGKCLRHELEWLLDPNDRHGDRASSKFHMPIEVDLCLVARLREMDRVCQPRDFNWRWWLQPMDVRTLENLIRSNEPSCSESLLDPRSDTLPEHVCVATLAESGGRMSPLTSLPSPGFVWEGAPSKAYQEPKTSNSGHWRGRAEIPPAIPPLLNLDVSRNASGAGSNKPYEGFKADLLYGHFELNRVLQRTKDTGRSPQWFLRGVSPIWPTFGEGHKPVGFFVQREVEGQLLKFTAFVGHCAVSVKRSAAEYEFLPHPEVTLLRDSESAAMYKTRSDLTQWYERVLVGQQAPRQAGRPVKLSRPDVQEKIRKNFYDALNTIVSEWNASKAIGRISLVELSEVEIAELMERDPRTIRRYIDLGIIPPVAEWPELARSPSK